MSLELQVEKVISNFYYHVAIEMSLGLSHLSILHSGGNKIKKISLDPYS